PPQPGASATAARTASRASRAVAILILRDRLAVGLVGEQPQRGGRDRSPQAVHRPIPKDELHNAGVITAEALDVLRAEVIGRGQGERIPRAGGPAEVLEHVAVPD